MVRPGQADWADPAKTIPILPDERVVHVSLLCFRYLGNTPTETTTRSLNIDPSGHYLIAAGQKSGKVVVFTFDPDNGTLKPVHTVDVGEAPWWVLVR